MAEQDLYVPHFTAALSKLVKKATPGAPPVEGAPTFVAHSELLSCMRKPVFDENAGGRLNPTKTKDVNNSAFRIAASEMNGGPPVRERLVSNGAQHTLYQGLAWRKVPSQEEEEGGDAGGAGTSVDARRDAGGERVRQLEAEKAALVEQVRAAEAEAERDSPMFARCVLQFSCVSVSSKAP